MRYDGDDFVTCVHLIFSSFRVNHLAVSRKKSVLLHVERYVDSHIISPQLSFAKLSQKRRIMMIRIIFHKNNLKQRNNTSKVFKGRKYSVSHGIRREGVRKEGRYGECAFGWSSKFIDRGNSDKTRPFPRAIHLWAVYDVRLSRHNVHHSETNGERCFLAGQ